MVPGDAQTWRKLGIVYTALGELKLAEHAEYSTYQMGLGQGGFGGSR
jgi:cytochrome c-type biogenesis protein CcmH/NrfG